MSEEKKPVVVHPATEKLSQTLVEITSAEGLQKYVLGYKKSGQPRAIYDIVKDFVKPKKKKKKNKKKKKKDDSVYSFYVNTKSKKGKKKKKGKKHWYFEDF